MYVIICRRCGWESHGKSYKAVVRNAILHFSSHYCLEKYGKDLYNKLRATCAHEVFRGVAKNFRMEDYFDVVEVK